MKRGIVGYHKDERDDWVAELDCCHNQHVRHDPPFQNRPWVTTESGRAEKLGLQLDCVLCDRFELPEGLTAYKQTPEFNEETIPAGLQGDHATRRGVWGLIHVLEGSLEYRALDIVRQLDSTEPGVVVPEMPHSVSPMGPVRFYVEFHRRD